MLRHEVQRPWPGVTTENRKFESIGFFREKEETMEIERQIIGEAEEERESGKGWEGEWRE